MAATVAIRVINFIESLLLVCFYALFSSRLFVRARFSGSAANKNLAKPSRSGEAYEHASLRRVTTAS
jgi:hypothetical protein